MTDIYKFAAQNNLRFLSKHGALTVEQLFQLDLRNTSGFDLDNVARTVNNELKAMAEESFVEDMSNNPRKKMAQVALDIVKDVIATKIEEGRAAKTKREKAVERKKILDALSAKKDQALTAASVEDLEKKLAALDE